MANFDKYSNYNENTSFSGIVFGANAPVLEVELNEMQQVADSKLAKALKAILGKTSSVTKLSTDSITTGADENGNYYLTVKDCILVTNNGWIVYVDNTTVNVDATNKRVFFAVVEKTVTYNDRINNYGNELGEAIENPIKDSRYPTETTRRKIITFKLRSSSGIPNETQSHTRYIPIADFNATTNTFNIIAQDNRIDKMEKQIAELMAKVV